MRRWWWLVLVALTLAPSAWAQSREAEARLLFRAGARAYDAGKFDMAAKAFEQAYELTPKPALRFSAAQALRRQYAMTPDAALLKKALLYYRQYVTEVKEGARVRDAAEAMGEIQLLLTQLGDAPAGETATETTATPQKGTLNIATSVDGAVGSVDGGPPLDLPTWVDLTPGKHHVVVRAKGYQPVERRVFIKAGRVAAVDPDLRETPARLSVETKTGAEVLVDGRPVGRAPMTQPVELASGSHRVVVGLGGYRVFADDVVLKRGQARKIEADLDMTAQRITSWVFFSGAVLAAAGGVVLTVEAISEQRQANDLKSTVSGEQRPLSRAEADEYNGHLSTRDNFVRFAAGAYTLAAVSAGVGLLLFALDAPDLAEASRTPDDDAQKTRTKRSKPAELEAYLGPGTLLVRGRF